MRRPIWLAAILAVAIAFPASAMATTSPTWNLNGTYTVNFTETAGPDAPGPYPYSVVIATTSDSTGAVTGTGTYLNDGVTTVGITGQVTGWNVALTLAYGSPYLDSNPFELVGTIDQQGGMSGTATDAHHRAFTWATSSGTVGLYTDKCDYGTYPGYTQVWHGFARATGETVTTTALPASGSVFIEASGTYFAGGSGSYDIQADAEYSQDASQRASSAPWTDLVNGYESSETGLLDLKVDGAFVDWGAYNAGHRYTLAVTPSGSPLTIGANIYDSYPPNNTGGLCVAAYADVTAPGIALVSALPAANGAGWNNAAVTVTWSCTDTGSGVVDATVTKTLSEGAAQSATGTCADKAGNTVSNTQSPFNIDLTAPGVTWNGSIANGATFAFGSVPASPSCTATDALSGPGACTVIGWSDAVGAHTLSATAYDVAGNSTTETRAYTVGAWTLKGFYQPVDMNGVWNVIKGGQTVPLKFEVFAGSTELTSTSEIKSFTTAVIACGAPSATADEVEVTTTGGTSLRYDATSGQFIQNWQTPKGAGICYRATMTTQDGSSLVALFKTK